MERDHAAMSDIMDPSGVSKHSKEVNKSTCQKQSEQLSIQDDVLAQATTQIPAFTSPSSAPGPSTDTIQWWPTKPHPKVKMDISRLSKLDNYTKVIAGREKGYHPHISAPRPSTPEPPSTLSRPLILSRRRSLPADVRLDVLKAPTTFDEWVALIIPLTEGQTGDNIFRLAHLLKNKWDQDQWIAYFTERKKFIEKAIKEAQAVLAAWKTVRPEWEAAFARWEAREEYYKSKVEMLQALVSTSIKVLGRLVEDIQADMSALGSRNHRSQRSRTSPIYRQSRRGKRRTAYDAIRARTGSCSRKTKTREGGS